MILVLLTPWRNPAFPCDSPAGAAKAQAKSRQHPHVAQNTPPSRMGLDASPLGRHTPASHVSNSPSASHGEILPTSVGSCVPSECRYTGNQKAVAVGKLSREGRAITWARCKAADSYWAEDRDAYVLSAVSKGRGCLSEMHVVGNVHCEGRLACKLGGLDRGDNPEFDVWTQPLIHGPPGSKNSVEVSSDLRTIRTPTGRNDGFLSYNLPNDAPSRIWVSWVATRDDDSPHTTCR